jgi:hypothetical protein
MTLLGASYFSEEGEQGQILSKEFACGFSFPLDFLIQDLARHAFMYNLSFLFSLFQIRASLLRLRPMVEYTSGSSDL